MDKKHILFLTYWFPSRKLPKNGNFIFRHAKAVATLHKVTILYVERDETIRSEYEWVEEKQENLRILKVYFKGSSLRLLNYWKKYRAYQEGLGRIGDFDLIHVNVLHYYALFALYFRVRKNINFVITEHWTRWLREPHSFSFAVYRRIMGIISSRASFILPVSNNLAEKMRDNGIQGRYEVVSNVVDTEIFYEKVEKERVERKFSFLHISGLNDAHKNYSGILRVVRNLVYDGYDFVLNIGGDGDLVPVQEYIHQYNLESTIAVFGELTESEVADKMRESDVFLLFSNYETQSCVIREAFSCGLPVISTRVGGVPELFPEDFGILIEKGDEAALYEAMKQCMEGKVNFANPQEMHRYVVTYFGIKAVASKLDKIYRTIY